MLAVIRTTEDDPRNGAQPVGEESTSVETYPLQIIELAPGISGAGVSQALRQAAPGRVALVVPGAAARSLTGGPRSLVHFNLLRRQAATQGVDLAVVTRSPRVRELASAVGLPIFGSLDGARRSTWHPGPSDLSYRPPPPQRDSRDRTSQRRRGFVVSRLRRVALSQRDPRALPVWLETIVLAAVLALCLTGVSALLAFVVPQAAVVLVPAQEPVAARITVTARADFEEVGASQNRIPARRIGQRVEGDETIAATGTRSAPDAPAQGTVVFTNRRSVSLAIPEGTVVATSTGTNIRFQTRDSVELPGGIGAQVAVQVEALEPGPAGNVRAFAINTIEGPAGLSASAINQQATWGGSVKQVPVVTQGDKDRLRAQLLQQVTQKAYVALGDLLDEGEFVPPETVSTLVVAETYDRFTDEEADQVTLRLRLLATALAVDGATGDELGLEALGQAIPRRGRLLSDSIRFTRGPATVSDVDGTPVIAYDVTASGVVVLDVDPAAVRGAIRGREVPEARQILQETWRLQTPPLISLGPDWLLPLLRRADYEWLPVPVADRIPWIPFRTDVQVEFVG